MLRWMSILGWLLLPGLAQAISITSLSVDRNVVGGASVDVELRRGRSLYLEAVLPADSLFSAAQAVVDFEVEADGPIAFVAGAQIFGRDAEGCPIYASLGGCDPLQGLTLGMLRTSPDPELLFTMEPLCCSFTGDVSTGGVGLAPGAFRFVLDVSQLQGTSQPSGADTRLVAFVEVVPEPSAAVVFTLGLLLVRAALRPPHRR